MLGEKALFRYRNCEQESTKAHRRCRVSETQWTSYQTGTRKEQEELERLDAMRPMR